MFFQIVKMENPYKEPRKGCVLCSVTVDYKNIQVSDSRVDFHSGCTLLDSVAQNEMFRRTWTQKTKSAHVICFIQFNI